MIMLDIGHPKNTYDKQNLTLSNNFDTQEYESIFLDIEEAKIFLSVYLHLVQIIFSIKSAIDLVIGSPVLLSIQYQSPTGLTSKKIG